MLVCNHLSTWPQGSLHSLFRSARLQEMIISTLFDYSFQSNLEGVIHFVRPYLLATSLSMH